MAQDEDLRVLVELKKKPVPAISVFGDTDGKAVAKLLWSYLGGWEVRLITPEDEDLLRHEAENCALLFIVINTPDDPKVLISRILSSDSDVVADVVAITRTNDPELRLKIQAQGFDNIIGWDQLETEEFRHLFYHKLRKGIVRLNARIKEKEYKSFQAYLSAAADAFIVFDQDRKLFFVSRLFREAYPKSAEILIRGVPVQRAFEAMAEEMGINKDDPQYKTIKEFWLTLAGQMELELDAGHNVRMTAVAMPDGQGTIVSMTDISDYKTQERYLAEKQSALESALESEQEASNLQKQFISMVSHEFRTPLAIIDGNAQMLQRRQNEMKPEDVMKRTKTIRSAVSRLVHMMEAVLSSNMLKTGRLDVFPEPMNLAQMIQELCDEQADLAKDHQFETKLDQLPQLLRLDRKIMTLVITNLLSNAVKYSQQDPKIAIEAKKEGKNIIICVTDNGVGIPSEELPQVFNRFYRASTAGTIPGTGLGLSLARELVQLHGGAIDVISEVGKGSIFRVILPYTT